MHKQARASARQLALQVSDELTAAIERARFYVATSQPKAFEADGQIIALTVLSKPLTVASGNAENWTAASRWVLPENSPSRLAPGDFGAINLKYPVDTDRIARGERDVLFAAAKSLPAFFRVAVPYGEKGIDGYTQALVAEIKTGKLGSIFSHKEGLFAFMLAARGSLVVASDTGHFGPDEDLSTLAIARTARESSQPQGSLDYRETPQGETQYSAFARVPAAPGLIVFVQAPHSRVAAALEPLWQAVALAGVAFAAVFGLLIWWYSARWSWELGELQAGGAHETQPAAITLDLIQPLLQTASSPPGRKLAGERIQAAVLHAHLHGLDRLSAEADPEKLLELLNTFHQKAVQAVESRQGVVDPTRGGSVVAFWGVSEAQENDVARAIETASEISEAAYELGESLKQAGLAPCRLGMGLHYGQLAVGQMGASGRLEYAAVGEALEIAARIQQFTDQFGTDFLMTGAAAKRAGEAFATEQVTSGDEETPELYELAEEEADAEAEVDAAAA